MVAAVFDIRETHIQGCYLLLPRIHEDSRGKFIKTFHSVSFAQQGLADQFAEQFYSVSHARVLRGLHLQLPPFDHAKLVCCCEGEIFDAVLDVRIGSKTFGENATFELNSIRAAMLYVPRGVAHGFYTKSGSATVLYSVSTVYSPSHDSGVLWNSAGISWPDDDPLISERDSRLPAFRDFVSPFRV